MSLKFSFFMPAHPPKTQLWNMGRWQYQMSTRNSRSAYMIYLKYEIKAHRGIHTNSQCYLTCKKSHRDNLKKPKPAAGHMAKYLHAVDESRSKICFQKHFSTTCEQIVWWSTRPNHVPALDQHGYDGLQTQAAAGPFEGFTGASFVFEKLEKQALIQFNYT